ncbi:MAG: alanine racemase, partial [Candidatus Eremiobacteraeota bacterium]|nr:alanine racemase [Candidatus Eremiobacteraeota bacterium]
AWRRRLNVPLRAVVKCDGYGWGYEALVWALEPEAQAFCVADFDELTAVRRFTSKPVVLLGSVPAEALAEVLDCGGLPTISTMDELAVVREWAASSARTPRIRVGLTQGAGWTGCTLEQLQSLAPLLADSGVEVEYWTHMTDMDIVEAQIGAFDRGLDLLRSFGVRVVAIDTSSTYPAAKYGARGAAARIGVGLFGAAASEVPGVRCAIFVDAPVVTRVRHEAGTRVGYGGTMLAMSEVVLTARAGYGDGVPKTLANGDDIMSVGMQYLTARGDRVSEQARSVRLLDRSTDLDTFARRCNRLAHEVVTAFGTYARANRAQEEV